jgi:hypothetical protein
VTDPSASSVVSYAHDIRPLFRDKDRASMLRAFDLWEYADVLSHQDAILDKVQTGSMPCDGAWPSEHVALFERWISTGSNA